jgi:hypothetical protein
MIDADTARFPASTLSEWKRNAEDLALRARSAGSRYRSIAVGEVRSEISMAELVALKELQTEFGCHIETDVHVAAGEGWLWLRGAVVRGEDLIAIDIREHHGNGIPYFQIEHLLDLCAKLQFPRFRKCVLYLVVVSDGTPELDGAVETRLHALLTASGLEGLREDVPSDWTASEVWAMNALVIRGGARLDRLAAAPWLLTEQQ